MNSDEFIAPPARPRTYMFATADDTVLATGSNKTAAAWGAGEYVSRCRLAAAVAPTGANLVLSLLVIDPSDGSTVRSTTGITLTAGSKTVAEVTFTPMMVERTYQLKLSVTQVGSTVAGTGLSVAVD